MRSVLTLQLSVTPAALVITKEPQQGTLYIFIYYLLLFSVAKIISPEPVELICAPSNFSAYELGIW